MITRWESVDSLIEHIKQHRQMNYDVITTKRFEKSLKKDVQVED